MIICWITRCRMQSIASSSGSEMQRLTDRLFSGPVYGFYLRGILLRSVSFSLVVVFGMHASTEQAAVLPRTYDKKPACMCLFPW